MRNTVGERLSSFFENLTFNKFMNYEAQQSLSQPNIGQAKYVTLSYHLFFYEKSDILQQILLTNSLHF